MTPFGRALRVFADWRVLAGTGLALGAITVTAGAVRADRSTLRVCADPNNLPFSDHEQRGFENQIAQIIARDLGTHVEYTWWAQRRGFVRNTLRANRCDLVVGVVAGDEQLHTTAPYYRSTYVFVTRRDRDLGISSFDDPRLRQLRIGLHVIGDDYNSLPPGVALARRGMVTNLFGFSIYGHYADASPPSALIHAVEEGKVDVAIAWGPLAGWSVKHSRVPLMLRPVQPTWAAPGIPFAYDISAGVRRDDHELARRVEAALARNRGEIREVLHDYGVPVVDTVHTLTDVAITAPERCEPRGGSACR